MKKIIYFCLVFILCENCIGQTRHEKTNITGSDIFTGAQISLDVNNMRTFIWNTGVFNQDISGPDLPGLFWPGNTQKSPVFTSGLCIGAYVNNELRIAAASYKGEYVPGSCSNGQFNTDARFKFYIIKRGDNFINNPDWLSWGQMVPFGAPYVDVNHNGTYEYYADTPGVSSAAKTIFICLTDGDSTRHSSSEGFGGGTKPLYAEVHLTTWAYDNPGYQDMQFFKYEIFNRNTSAWNSAYFSIFCDPDLGDANDDYLGCDSIRNLGYCYNSDNIDGSGNGRTYGIDPPAYGITFLNCSTNFRSNSFIFINNTGSGGPSCESEPASTLQAYNFMKGYKNDSTPYVIPFTSPPLSTKFVFSGNPETNVGWTEYLGRVSNCGGNLTGDTIPGMPGNRTFVMSHGSENLTLNPGNSQTIYMVQMMAKGSNNLNSVTQLKQLSDVAQQLCQNGFVIGINPISTEIPTKYSLYQNYPNPFNPTTQIKFEVPLTKGGQKGLSAKLIIYNALAQEITTLINEELKPGTYSLDWNAANYPSGVYFYKLETENYSDTKKMVLLK